MTPEASRSQQCSGFEGFSERALLGIPAAENDEHDRGLVFLFDSWTGQPSQTSASEGSECAAPKYSPTAPPSDQSSSVPLVMTPQSDSDVSMMEISPMRLGGSEASFRSGVDVPGTPSTSESITFGSHNLLESQSGSWFPAGRTSPTMSPSLDPTSSVQVDPLEGIDPRETIVIDKEDIEYLSLLQAQARQGQPNDLQVSVSPWHDPGPGISHLSPNARNLPKENTRTRKRKADTSTPYPSRSASTTLRAKATKQERAALTLRGREKASKLREIGVCLRCLVNHEEVRI